MAEELRKIFVYLAVVAIVLGYIGIFIMITNSRGLTGHVLLSEEEQSREEVEKHNSIESCWITMNNRVYDITLFLQVYKDESLKDKCGKDVGINYFSKNEKRVLEIYDIGSLK